MSPRLPVVLVERIFNGNNRVFPDEAQVDIGEFLASDPFGGVGVRVLEVQIVLAILVELGRSDVQRDLDATLIARLLDCLDEQLERFLSTRYVGGEATLITDVNSWPRDVSIFTSSHR